MANKITPRFKKGDTAYFFNGSTIPNNVGYSMSILMVSAWIIKIHEIKGSQIIGYTHKFWHEIKHLGIQYINIQLLHKITDKKLNSMKDSDLVLMRFDAQSKHLLTRDELKMEMVKWIANDFDNPEDRDNY